MGSCGRAHALLESIQKHIGGTLRISWRGVPYLLLDGPDRFSISYFGRANEYRTWTNSGRPDNRPYRTFADGRELVDHFTGLGFKNK